MSTTTFTTPWGNCALIWEHARIIGFRLFEETPDAKPTPTDSPPQWIQTIISRVRAHLEGNLQNFSDLDYDFSDVSAFHRAVYLHTLTVKAGTTCSYGDITRMMGQSPTASRAVGAALGANPWPLLIPCHRVVAADGKMTGFSGTGGIKTKLRLLALEGTQLFAE